MVKVMSVLGTEQEAIGMAPLVKELEKRRGIRSVICAAAQQLDPILKAFRIRPDYDLNIMKPDQPLSDITAAALRGVENVIRETKPDVVLVYGDGTTAFAAALAAFYQKVRIGHVEAGLRTGDRYTSCTEEKNRQMIDRVAELLFVPTEPGRQNLIYENIPKEKIFVTGNPSIDALASTVRIGYSHPELDWIEDGERLILLALHRQDIPEEQMRNIFRAVRRVTEEFPDVKGIFPIRRNSVAGRIAEEVLTGYDRLRLIEPLEVFDFHNFTDRSELVLTDSCGIQEEAPSLYKPVLVLRHTAERPEGVKAGTLKLVGTEEENICRETVRLLTDRREYERMSRASNPYGDGHASERIADAILSVMTGKTNSAA